LTTLSYKELLWEPEEGWRENAACRGMDVDVFFPAEGDVDTVFPAEESAHAALEAKAICANCPVADICLQYSLATNQADGVWGGLDTNERRRVRRRIRDQSRRKAS
jgi:WhiB family redox-sensing transcriptional regulator